MKCPTCGGTVEWRDNPARPFCSERCKLIDFGRWANEEYRVPASDPLAQDGAAHEETETEDMGQEA